MEPHLNTADENIDGRQERNSKKRDRGSEEDLLSSQEGRKRDRKDREKEPRREVDDFGREIKRKRSVSRERSPRSHSEKDRDRRRNRDRDRERKKEKEKDRSRHPEENKNKIQSSNGSSDSSGKKGADGKGKSVQEKAIISELDEDGQTMLEMGFPLSFNSSKGKKVEGGDVSAARVKPQRIYRQYMNRRGGFNRLLDPEPKVKRPMK